MADLPRCHTIAEPRARKDHKCCECRGIITKGELYHLFSGVWDCAGTYKTCKECQQLRSDVSKKILDQEDCPAFGELYQHVFDSGDHDWIGRFMNTRKKRNAPDSPREWMEVRWREIELKKK